MERNKKKIWMYLSLAVVVVALGSLLFQSFTGNLVYFHTPSEMKDKSQELAGRKVRIGGMVQAGSLVKEEGTLKIRFIVRDDTASLPVRYEGIVPDLFREGQGVVVEGIWQPGQEMVADTILAKHSEDYMPVEMSEEGIKKSKESILKSLQ